MMLIIIIILMNVLLIMIEMIMRKNSHSVSRSVRGYRTAVGFPVQLENQDKHYFKTEMSCDGQNEPQNN